MHNPLLMAEPLTVERLTDQTYIFIAYTFLYGLLFCFLLYMFLKQEIRSFKRAIERAPETAIREALTPFRQEMRQNHSELLRTHPATKEAILTHQVSSLKLRLDELKKSVAKLLNPPEVA